MKHLISRIQTFFHKEKSSATPDRIPEDMPVQIREHGRSTAGTIPGEDVSAAFFIHGKCYTVWKQKSMAYKKYNDYMAYHGCSTCSLTTVLRACTDKYNGACPDDIIDGPIASVGGRLAFCRNFGRPMRLQMPVSLYGICKILKANGIKNTYVEAFTDSEARKDILAHLERGLPVIVQTYSLNRATGKPDKKWAGSTHTMIMIGLTADNQIIIADSANRTWYQGPQRFKITAFEGIIDYMFPCTSRRHRFFWTGKASGGGYIKIYS